ncbi:MAG: hypothetical protein WDN26_05845 [Chitinophagaceae bacterium]
MNTKTLLGGLIAGIVSFLVGYLIYGVLLMDYFKSLTIPYEGLMKDPVIWEIGIANLIWGMMLAYIFNLAGVRSFSKGLTAGFIIFFLSSLAHHLMTHATMNLSGYRIVVMDAACFGILGAVSGAVLGWWMGRGKSA